MTGSASAYVSTGHLPPASEIDRLLAEAYRESRDDRSGAVSTVYPVLAETDPDLFGIGVANIDGRIHTVGDAYRPFPIMSVSKPFVFALICQALGPGEIRNRVGVNATGYSFNALSPIEIGEDGRTNPMVNPGAIATTSLVPGATLEDRWNFVQQGLSAFAGHALPLNESVFASAMASNFRNRGIVHLLHGLGRIYCDPLEALELYTRQCSLDVTAVHLAVMGATLADGGVNPITHKQVVSPMACRHTLAVMATSGLYETSGDWLYDVGLPGKSGIGGGIVTVAPGKGGLGTYAPRLDAAGNSIRGQKVTRYLSEQLGMGLFASKPFSEEISQRNK